MRGKMLNCEYAVSASMAAVMAAEEGRAACAVESSVVRISDAPQTKPMTCRMRSDAPTTDACLMRGGQMREGDGREHGSEEDEAAEPDDECEQPQRTEGCRHYTCSRPMRRSMRFGIGGCVEKSEPKPPPMSGATMKRCAVEAVASMGTRFE